VHAGRSVGEEGSWPRWQFARHDPLELRGGYIVL
jgi:hypothetical protein